MSQVARPPRVAPIVYRPVDPVAALALGAVILGLGALFSGIADWEWQFDPSYWADLAWRFAGTVVDAGSGLAAGLLEGLAQSAYSSFTDSAPILMAALLLALFALGPNEIMSAFAPRSHESQ